MGFLTELFRDDNEINEKAVLGFLSFSMSKIASRNEVLMIALRRCSITLSIRNSTESDVSTATNVGKLSASTSKLGL